MRKKLVNITLFSLLCLSAFTTNAQSIREKKGDSKFDYYEYVNAIEVYEKIVNKGYKNTNVLSKLADAYYFKGDLKAANKWYKELFDLASQDKTTIASEYYYRYAQTLRAIEDYKQADEYLSTFASLEKLDSRGILFEESKDSYLKDINVMNDRYKLKNLSINTQYSDYGSTLINDQLFFTSARATEDGVKVQGWTNEAPTAIYHSTINRDGSFSEPKKFEQSTSKKVNDASAAFTSDGKTMYFTRNNSRNGKKIVNDDRSILLKLYKTTLQNDSIWSAPTELPFNSNDYSTAHPALTPDGKWLYFVSDQKGSLGDSDIFRVAINENGTYGKLENVGAKINTEGRETFPFISKDNYLYFSSDGRPGLGGLDVYMAKLNVDGTFGQVVNVGAPINSPSDDFGFYLDRKNKRGFVSSNREGGKGGDDIYYFQEIDCKQQLKGRVFNQSTQESIPNATITIYNAAYTELASYKTDAQGFYQTEDIDCDQKVRVKVEADGFETTEVSTTLGNEFSHIKEMNIGLHPVVEKITVEDDLFKKLQLQPIYFDFNKFSIRQDATVELAKLVEVMNMYPNLKIDVRSHTDSRGGDAFNLKLSNLRAKATRDWMVNQGIDASRITYQGYGEMRLLNKCSNNVSCTEQEHQANRRSEFIVVDLKK